ncbi:hypothetical protein GCM10007049_07700 [Echinicola pacifica]|uniref:Uncharacterized protein n=1 Tax=Echinicola pacifica TaxID=346377 RepID=A0A918UL29_9BACT|nr:hypothetical protein GCM10007049_07700 [Echinicola pacifica]
MIDAQMAYCLKGKAMELLLNPNDFRTPIFYSYPSQTFGGIALFPTRLGNHYYKGAELVKCMRKLKQKNI